MTFQKRLLVSPADSTLLRKSLWQKKEERPCFPPPPSLQGSLSGIPGEAASWTVGLGGERGGQGTQLEAFLSVDAWAIARRQTIQIELNTWAHLHLSGSQVPSQHSSVHHSCPPALEGLQNGPQAY